MASWRKTGKNWAKGTKIINIAPRYKVNTVVGYIVSIYDFSKRGTLTQQRTILKTLKTAHLARQFVGKYMRFH